ncbi:MAG TPA: hypothetical protein VIK37_02800 [Candidatus Saccharimonadales bacterium]
MSELAVALKELVPKMREIDARKDAFGNMVRLLWNPEDNSVHLSMAGFDIEVPGDKVLEARDHSYPMLFSKIGRTAAEEFLVTYDQAA